MTAKNYTPIKTASPTLRTLFLHMKQRGLTQKQLGKATGTTCNVIRQYRNGDHAPNIMRVEEMADALGLEIVLVPKRRAAE